MLEAFASEIGLVRAGEPLATLTALNSQIYERFEYSPQSTCVDSPIDDALGSRRGVCQDFSHIMLALARQIGVPCRYVSGYLFQADSGQAMRSTDGATHAWVEAWLPARGWVGFDPTNNVLAGDRHIKVAIGRDYADVPPTRGVFKGTSAVRSELAVAVRVGPVHTAGSQFTGPEGSGQSAAATIVNGVQLPRKSELYPELPELGVVEGAERRRRDIGLNVGRKKGVQRVVHAHTHPGPQVEDADATVDAQIEPEVPGEPFRVAGSDEIERLVDH
jgi:hypothetical protein